MAITRRNLLKGIAGGLIAAPFVVESGVLMPVRKIIEPVFLYGDGIRDDAKAIQHILDGGFAIDYKNGFPIRGRYLPPGEYYVGSTLEIKSGSTINKSIFNSNFGGPVFEIKSSVKNAIITNNMIYNPSGVGIYFDSGPEQTIVNFSVINKG